MTDQPSETTEPVPPVEPAPEAPVPDGDFPDEGTEQPDGPVTEPPGVV